MVRGFLDHLVVERGLSGHTVAAYRRDLTRYTDWLTGRGTTDPASVTPATISEFVVWLGRAQAEGADERPALAPASIARHVAAVRSLHRFAHAEGITPDNPAADTTPPQLSQRLPKAISVAEVQALLDAPDTSTPEGLRDKALLELLYGTGARVSEVVELAVDDVVPSLRTDEDGRTPPLRLVGKGDKERIVPLGRYAREAVEAWLVRGRPDWAARSTAAGARLLLNSRGRPLTRQLAYQVLRRTAERAGVTAEVSPHTLRHSYATHLLDGGADVRVVQELLGHASVTTTQLYTKVTVDTLREVWLTAHPRAY